jgi:hypothetical protein
MLVIAAMALSMAPSAAAETTALCKVWQNPCEAKNQIKSLHLVNSPGSVERLLSSELNILCLSVLAEVALSELGEPQAGNFTSLSFGSCGTGATHENCKVEAAHEELVGIHFHLHFVQKVVLPLILWGRRHISCTIFEFMKIDCTYDETGMKLSQEDALENKGSGNGMLTAEKAPLKLWSGGELCPSEISVDDLLEPLEEVYGAE